MNPVVPRGQSVDGTVHSMTLVHLRSAPAPGFLDQNG